MKNLTFSRSISQNASKSFFAYLHFASYLKVTVNIHYWTYKDIRHCVFLKKITTHGYFKVARSRSCVLCNQSMKSFKNSHKVSVANFGKMQAFF